MATTPRHLEKNAAWTNVSTMGLVRNENTEASGLKQTKKKLRIESISKLVQNWGVRSSPACTSKTHHSREEGRKGGREPHPHTHSQCPRCRKIQPWTNGNKPSSPLRKRQNLKLLPSHFTRTMNLWDTSVQHTAHSYRSVLMDT